MLKKFPFRRLPRNNNSLLISLFLGLTIIGSTAFSVEIPDPQLELAIRITLGKPTGEITQADMESMIILNAQATPNRKIFDLTGLEAAVNLSILELTLNRISDLSPLSGMKALTSLDVNGNQIRDLSPLSGLTNLTNLEVAQNPVSDWSPLSGLTNLTSLALFNSGFSDLNPLSELTNLTQLILWGNGISDLGPLSGLTALTRLLLSGNQISDLGPLSGLTALAELDLSGNQISDLSPLTDFPSLVQLSISSNPVSDFTPLSGMKALTSLSLPGIALTDLSLLSGLTALTSLFLYDNQISDLSPLSHLTALSVLDLRGNQIRDLSPLSGLTALTILDLSGNQISDLSPLSELTSLNVLNLRSNQVFDVRPLDNLTNLRRIFLSNNNILSIGALAGLTNPDRVFLQNNFLDIQPGSEALQVIGQIQAAGATNLPYEPQENVMAGLSLLDDLQGVLNSSVWESETFSDNPDLFNLVANPSGFTFIQYGPIENPGARQVFKKFNGIAHYVIDWSASVEITLDDVDLVKTGEKIGLGFLLTNSSEPRDTLFHSVNLVAEIDETGNPVLRQGIETNFSLNDPDSPGSDQSPVFSRTIDGNHFRLFLFWLAEKQTLLAAYDSIDGQLDGIALDLGTTWGMNPGDSFDFSLHGFTSSEVPVGVNTFFFTNFMAGEGLDTLPLNDYAPVANPDVLRVGEGQLVTRPNLLNNDTDGDLPADRLTVNTIPVSEPTYGSLTLSADGSFTYWHDDSENFSDSFIYEISDSLGKADTAIVNITIHPIDETGLLGLNVTSLDTIDYFGPADIALLRDPEIPGSRVSPWYLNYNITHWPWIEHHEHGWQYVFENDAKEGIYIWDLGLGEWIFLNADTYRWMYLFGENPGWVWTFEDNTPDRRFFQRADDDSLFSVPAD